MRVFLLPFIVFVCPMCVVCAGSELVSVDLQIEPTPLSATLIIFFLPDSDSAEFSGNVQVDLGMDFYPDGFGERSHWPRKADWFHITGSSSSIADMSFRHPFGPDETMLTRTENIGARVFGFSPVEAASVAGNPPPYIGRFPATNVGIVVDTGKYYNWQEGHPETMFSYNFADDPTQGYMISGTGEVRISLSSVDGDIARYDVAATYPVNAVVYPGLFALLTVSGSVEASGSFTRDLSAQRAPSWIKADANRDDAVNDTDLNLWLSSIQDASSLPEQSDLLARLYHFGSTDEGALRDILPVPEPTTLSLAAIGFVVLLAQAWRIRKLASPPA